MKFKGSLLFIIFALLTLLTVSMYPFGFSESEQNTVNLQTYPVSDFGNSFDQSNNIIWKANFSRFAKPTDPSVELSPPDTNVCALQYIKGKPEGLSIEVANNMTWCLGIKAQFTVKGYNYIEIYPAAVTNGTMAEGSSNSKPDIGKPAVASPLSLMGVVKSIDMWVWGGNYKYLMEFYLQDYKGFLHRLPAGYIDFVGWKDLRTDVPDSIPQAERHVPFIKHLKLSMIKLWADPEERVDQFYCYFDYLQVQTDVYLEDSTATIWRL